MNQQTHRHSFIKNELVPTLFTCHECSCIQYKEKTTMKPHNFYSKYENDPVTSYFTSMNAQTIQWSSDEAQSAQGYLLNRSEGINQIKAIATHYGLPERIYHSSIYLLDYLCITKEGYSDNVQLIQRTAAICLVLVTKFIENGEKAYLLESELFTKHKDDQYKMEEIEILKAINYDLFFVTPYDSLSFFLNNGIIFQDEAEGKAERDKGRDIEEEEEEKKKKIPLEKIYYSCLLQLNILIEKNLYIKYTPFQLAFSIISLTRHISGFNERNELLEELYGYDIKQYIECYNSLKSKVKIKQKKHHQKGSGSRDKKKSKSKKTQMMSSIRKESLHNNQIEEQSKVHPL